MGSASFAYHRASSVSEAIATFAAVDDARFLAGGQSLVPMMHARQLEPKNIIDIGAIGELGELCCADGLLRIGALVRHGELCEPRRLIDLAVPEPLAGFLATAGNHIGNLAIRNRGTIGGSMALAEPHAEWPLAMTLLEANVIISGADGRRACPIETFLLGPGRTALAPGEIIVEIVVPLPTSPTRYGFSQTALRHEGTRATAVARLSLEAAGRGVISAVISGLGTPPARLFTVDVEVVGDEAILAASDLVSHGLARAGLHQDDAFAHQVAGAVAARAICQVLRDDRS